MLILLELVAFSCKLNYKSSKDGIIKGNLFKLEIPPLLLPRFDFIFIVLHSVCI